MIYVTYDSSGKLTGGFNQDLQASQENNYIEVTEDKCLNWVIYQANSSRDGIEIAPIVPPIPVVPQEVAMWQAQTIMENAGLTAGVNSYIASLPTATDRNKANAKLLFSSTMHRDDPFLAQASGALGLTSQQIDQMFIDAAALT